MSKIWKYFQVAIAETFSINNIIFHGLVLNYEIEQKQRDGDLSGKV